MATEADCSNPDISMLCPLARHFTCIASVDSAGKWVPGGDNLVKGVQRYELFGGIALENHALLLKTKRFQDKNEYLENTLIAELKVK